MPADNHVIDVRGVTKRFDGKTVVNQLSLQVNQGEIFGFLGPNGSGKTTFLRMICGLLHMDEGEGTCLGYKIRTHPAEIKRQTGYMTQRFSFYEDLTIKENLDFVARVYEMPNRKQRVQEGLEQLGLVSRCNQLAGALSGGWKQRLALAACLLHRPKLLLLDEPTAGVDPSARRDFWEEVHRLASEGMTVLITTHYMDEAERCHRLAYISYGDLLAQGTAEELIEQSGLHTWEVAGPGVASLTESLRELGGVEQVAAFGNALHISGHD
ncbi:MAG: ABC transporter ATP-binding protein, partial [Verrucomicrobia bacterium]|nr:ABC transporter ATP-binding protein [Verrucomicrobiota bacterium]